MKSSSRKRNALLFVLSIGIISMFSDFTHEGARSVYGPFLSLVGASAFVIALTSGLGEFIGQALRIVTGYITDKTKKYWLMMMIGYALNLLAIPLLALVSLNGWVLAVGLILLERVGKAIRAPAKSTLTSFAGSEIGSGKAFAINEALDQLGALLGPLFMFLILTIRTGLDQFESYQLGFLLLGIVAIITLMILMFAKYKYPKPEQIDQSSIKHVPFSKHRIFWIYLIGIGLIGAGFIDYPIIAYHINNVGLLSITMIPLLYAIAMGVDALSALLFGWLYDKLGILSLIFAIVISSGFSLFIFAFDQSFYIYIGIILWGIGMGAQESILKAVVASMIPKENRGVAYGYMQAIFGLFWFLGSIAIGALYLVSLTGVIIFSISMQLLSIPVLLYVFIQHNKKMKEVAS